MIDYKLKCGGRFQLCGFLEESQGVNRVEHSPWPLNAFSATAAASLQLVRGCLQELESFNAFTAVTAIAQQCMRECTEEEANKVAIIQHTYRSDSVFECNEPRLCRAAHGRHYHELGSKRLCTWAQCCRLIFALGCECWVDEFELWVRVKCVPAGPVVHN
jgi:hypothetical protein